MNCDKATVAAIDIDAVAAGSIIDSNNITNNDGYSIDVAANANNVIVAGNNITGNAKGLRNTDGANTLNAILNWWGDASGPTISTNSGGTGEKITATGAVTYKPWLHASQTSARVCAATTPATASGLDAVTAVGVDISGFTNAAVQQMMALKYSANPIASDPPHTALPGAYFDVWTSAASTTNITLRFYADGITKDTDAYVWSSLEETWKKCSHQGASGTGAFVWVTVMATGSVPSSSDLTDTPFVLVAGPADRLGTPAIQAPVAGAADIGLNPTFMWTEVTDAESYEIQISDNYGFIDPILTAAVLPNNVYSVPQYDALAYSATYFWRVRASTSVMGLAGEDGPWVAGVFTTMAEPAEPEPPIVIEQPEIVIPPQVPPVIEIPVAETPAYIWAIIGIGAVLVIVVIVLIVRTRRPV
jgi:hypothetical protein